MKIVSPTPRLGDTAGAAASFLGTNNAIKVAEKAISLTGNPALSRANPLQRHYRDTLCGRVHSPQEDTILTSAGRFAFASFAKAAS